ncbi:two-component sensor histidine kinase [Acidobacteria bacterium ACD]|nr:MAG: two-component sensor histidine kinase [Acidobacteriota bacterium]MDL1948664.1 two-component sensor histidine kinase [Acidobacteria bacterium ACD]
MSATGPGHGVGEGTDGLESGPRRSRREPGAVLLLAAAGAAAATPALVLSVWPGRGSLPAGPGLPALLAGCGLLAASAFAAALFALLRSVSAEEDALVQSARRWAGGELSHRTPGAGRRLSRLRKALDQMAASLQRSHETNRLEAEERVRQAERLATAGRLAAGVAHEINNPLGAILLYANLLVEATPAEDPRRGEMERIAVQAARAKEIVKGLLDFARQTPAELRRVDLNEVVLSVLGLLARQPRLQAVRVRTELSPLPLPVEADPAKLQQVFVNVVLNALDAMKDGGELTVRSGFSEKPGTCRVAVSDTGAGIAAEDLPRVFDPFFSTKEVGEGVGLGLAISYGIVEQHRGGIDIQSVPGAGTTVRVLLPLAPEGA